MVFKANVETCLVLFSITPFWKPYRLHLWRSKTHQPHFHFFQPCQKLAKNCYLCISTSWMNVCCAHFHGVWCHSLLWTFSCLVRLSWRRCEVFQPVVRRPSLMQRLARRRWRSRKSKRRKNWRRWWRVSRRRPVGCSRTKRCVWFVSAVSLTSSPPRLSSPLAFSPDQRERADGAEQGRQRDAISHGSGSVRARHLPQPSQHGSGTARLCQADTWNDVQHAAWTPRRHQGLGSENTPGRTRAQEGKNSD